MEIPRRKRTATQFRLVPPWMKHHNGVAEAETQKCRPIFTSPQRLRRQEIACGYSCSQRGLWGLSCTWFATTCSASQRRSETQPNSDSERWKEVRSESISKRAAASFESKSGVQTPALVVAARLIMPRKFPPIAAGGPGVFGVASVKLTSGGEGWGGGGGRDSYLYGPQRQASAEWKNKRQIYENGLIGSVGGEKKKKQRENNKLSRWWQPDDCLVKLTSPASFLHMPAGAGLLSLFQARAAKIDFRFIFFNRNTSVRSWLIGKPATGVVFFQTKAQHTICMPQTD